MKGFRRVLLFFALSIFSFILLTQSSWAQPSPCDLSCGVCPTPGACEASEIGCVWHTTGIPPCISYDDEISFRLKTMAARMICILAGIGPYILLFVMSIIALRMLIESDDPQARTFGKKILWENLLGILIITGFVLTVTLLDPGIDLENMCQDTPSLPTIPTGSEPLKLVAFIVSPVTGWHYTTASNIEFEAAVSGGSPPYGVSWWAYSTPTLLSNDMDFILSGGDAKLGFGQHTIMLVVNDTEGEIVEKVTPIDIGAPGIISFTFKEDTTCI
ncbi:MAG: hypothetical protein ABH950_01890 [Candidatus Altiarchaeota archaeon]